MQDMLEPVRPTLWNVPSEFAIVFYAMAALAVIVCGTGIWLGWETDKNAPKQNLPKAVWVRLKTLLRDVFLQRRILKKPVGILHALVFFTFFLLFLGTAAATIDWDIAKLIFGRRILAGSGYLVYKLVLDIAGIVALAILLVMFVRRFCLRGLRSRTPALFLLFVFLIVILASGFALEGLRLAVQKPAWIAWSPVGMLISELFFAGISEGRALCLHQWLWLFHGIAGLLFVALIPFTFLEHLYRTPVSIYWRKLPPKGRLERIPEMESQETFGLSKSGQITDKMRMSLGGCTGCRRCTQVCPLVAACSDLDPFKVLTGMKAALTAGKDADLGKFVDKSALSICTTCGACAQACPARIDIPGLIVEMRRHYAIEEGFFAEHVQEALEASISAGNPWGMDPSLRLAWTKGLDVPIARAGEYYEYLYWVGCSAAFDERSQKIAVSMVKIFKSAGIRFAVMAEERCLEDFARRAGEEYAFEQAALENISNLRKYQFKHIVAHCPHCFNTLKNEYPDFEGGEFSVVHHTQLIQEMLASGRLKLKSDAVHQTLALHDPCYLARYNDSVGTFRKIADALPGVNRRETYLRGKTAMCCGAGGAQYFAHSPARKIPIIRIKDLSQKADCIATACPFCLSMLEGAKNAAGTAVPVQDIAEMVARSLQD